MTSSASRRPGRARQPPSASPRSSASIRTTVPPRCSCWLRPGNWPPRSPTRSANSPRSGKRCGRWLSTVVPPTSGSSRANSGYRRRGGPPRRRASGGPARHARRRAVSSRGGTCQTPARRGPDGDRRGGRDPAPLRPVFCRRRRQRRDRCVAPGVAAAPSAACCSPAARARPRGRPHGRSAHVRAAAAERVSLTVVQHSRTRGNWRRTCSRSREIPRTRWLRLRPSNPRAVHTPQAGPRSRAAVRCD